MIVLWIALALLSVPAALIVSNLYWTQFREARGVAMYLSDESLLRRIITRDLLQRPPKEIARFVQPVSDGYQDNMRVFLQADDIAHSTGRFYLRIAMLGIVVASGFVGYLAFGWYGLALPIVNLIAMTMTFNAASGGPINKITAERAAEHVQIVAIILSRWYGANPGDAARWVNSEPSMKLLADVVTGGD